MNKLLSISEISKLLKLTNKKNNKPSNHIIRYWETQFSQVKPIILKKRRYYNDDQVEVIKLIKFLLKDEGLRINGVKKILKKKIKSLDEYNSISLKTDYQKNYLKTKTNTLLQKIRKLKNYGKKNSLEN